MVAYRLKMNLAEVNRINRAAAVKVATDTTRRVLNRAIIGTPVRHGYLRSHNQMRVRESGLIATGEVFNIARYAKAVHDGRPAKVIRPKHKKVLRFEIGGEVVFAKSVRVKATRGRPWLFRALTDVAGKEGWKITRIS